jgi:hypothetical protein
VEIPPRGMLRYPTMDATTAHSHHHHEPLPTSGRALDQVALSATLHCLTGCAIGEIVGVAIGTALGWSNLATIALAIVLAFVFGYSLTSLPLLRAGLALAVVIPIAFASDTLSIAVMELVDNAIILVIPGAMDAGLDDVLFWGSLSFALFIAGFFAYPVNRWLLQRGKGHTAVHETGIHGGPSPRMVGAIAAVAGVFGTVVLVADALGG